MIDLEIIGLQEHCMITTLCTLLHYRNPSSLQTSLPQKQGSHKECKANNLHGHIFDPSPRWSSTRRFFTSSHGEKRTLRMWQYPKSRNFSISTTKSWTSYWPGWPPMRLMILKQITYGPQCRRCVLRHCTWHLQNIAQH